MILTVISFVDVASSLSLFTVCFVVRIVGRMIRYISITDLGISPATDKSQMLYLYHKL